MYKFLESFFHFFICVSKMIFNFCFTCIDCFLCLKRNQYSLKGLIYLSFLSRIPTKLGCWLIKLFVCFIYDVTLWDSPVTNHQGMFLTWGKLPNVLFMNSDKISISRSACSDEWHPPKGALTQMVDPLILTTNINQGYQLVIAVVYCIHMWA